MAIKAFPLVNEPMLDTEWQQIFHKLYKGVSTGLEVTADGGGLRVFVSAGEGGVAGHGIKLTDTEELSIEATGSARTARVVLDPVAPHVKVRYSAPSSTQYLLAEVAVAANAVTIAPNQVTKRSKSIMEELSSELGISWAALTGKPSTFPPSSHTHNASDINAGTLSDARIPTLSITAKTSGNLPVSRVTGVGAETISTANPSGGSNGDKWFKV